MYKIGFLDAETFLPTLFITGLTSMFATRKPQLQSFRSLSGSAAVACPFGGHQPSQSAVFGMGSVTANTQYWSVNASLHPIT